MSSSPQTRFYTFRGQEILCRPDGSIESSPVCDGHDATTYKSPDGALGGFKLHAESDPPPEYSFNPVRSFMGILPETALAPVTKTLGILNWIENARFCGRCGSPAEPMKDETAQRCVACGLTSYPRISPAILAVIRNGGKLLLARNASFKNGIFSLIAGFVEPGENFEECVAREVKEEVGLSVEDIRYKGSQPWPFPDSLMIGFECTSLSNEIIPDGIEIVEAGWFGPDDHPPLPMPGSLSRKLIDEAFGLCMA